MISSQHLSQYLLTPFPSLRLFLLKCSQSCIKGLYVLETIPFLRTFEPFRSEGSIVYTFIFLTRVRALLLDGTLLTALATLRRQPLSNYYTGLHYGDGGIRGI